MGDGAPSRPARLTGAVAAAVAAVVVVAWLLADTGVTAGALARYVGYCAGFVVLPGVLVHRALVGVSRTWFHEIAWGALTGLAVQFVVWLPLSRVGLNTYTPWWAPVAVVGILASGAGRRRVAGRPPERLGWWAWSPAVLAAYAVPWWASRFFDGAWLPPGPSRTNQDHWWHLGLVQELMRAGPPQVPHVAGDQLKYHYFAHADMASASLVTRIDPELVVFRLWPVAAMLLVILAVTVAAEWIARSAAAGHLAAWLACGLTTPRAWWPGHGVSGSGSAIGTNSSTHLLALAMFAGGGAALVAVLRGEFAGRRRYVWLVVVVVAASASKSTVAAVWMMGALAGWAGARLTRHPDRRAWIAPLVVLLGGAVVFPFASSTSGGRITLFGSLRLVGDYAELTGDTTERGADQGWVLDSLMTSRGLAIGVVTAIAFVGGHVVRLAGMVLWRDRAARRDPALWFLTACTLAGWAAYFVLDHSGSSQGYFLSITTPATATTTAWWVTRRLAHDRRHRAAVLAAGAAVGTWAFLANVHVGESVRRMFTVGPVAAVLIPTVTALVAGVAAWLLRATTPGRWVTTGAVPAVAVLALTVVPTLDSIAWNTKELLTESPEPPDPGVATYVSAGEVAGALWLREASGRDDVVVTNVHCRRPVDDLSRCESRAFWVTGLSGRRAVVESWGYTGASHALHLVDGRRYMFHFEPWTERIELSRAVIEDADPGAVATVRERYGADWVFVAERFGRVAPELAELADLVYAADGVSVYRLR